MDVARADGKPAANAVRAVVALVAVCCCTFLLSPVNVAILAFGAAGCALALPRCRMTAVEALTGMGFMAFMFGPAGVGGFVLMQALVIAPLAAGLRGARPVLVLAVASAVAGVAAVCSAAFLEGVVPTRWAAFAPMAAPFALAAPALGLRAMVVAARGQAWAETQRLNTLAGLLIATVVGAGVGGLHGAAVGWAAGQVAIPLAMLAAGPRAALVHTALGVLAAGFVATLATAAALGFAGEVALAAVPAAALGLVVWGLALQVHAPGAARRLWRSARGLAVAVRRPISAQPAGVSRP